MNDFILSLACFLATLALYFANKKLYRRRRTLLLMPLVLTPMILVLLLVVTHISYQDYIGETHWLLWLLGPATIAFAVPVYENLHIIRRHWLSLSAGVTTAVLVAVYSSVWLARLLTLPEEVQRSLAVRSITTPFALEAAKQMGGRTGPGGVVRGDHRGVRHGGGRHSVFVGWLYAAAWRKGPDLAHRRTAPAPPAPMNWGRRRA